MARKYKKVSLREEKNHEKERGWGCRKTSERKACLDVENKIKMNNNNDKKYIYIYREVLLATMIRIYKKKNLQGSEINK